MGLFDRFTKKRKTILINDSLTITLINGNQLVINNATQEMYDYVSNKEHSDHDVEDFFFNIIAVQKEERRLQELKEKEVEKTATPTMTEIMEKKEEEKKKQDIIIEAAKEEMVIAKEMSTKYSTLTASGDFIEKDGVLYLNEVPTLSIPGKLVTEFIRLIEKVNNDDSEALDYYIALKNFWMWCSLNPNPESRENLFRFIQNNKLKINKYGFFASYRRVVSKGGVENDFEDEEDYDDSELVKKEIPNKALSEFISSSYLKVKSQKKSPKNFWIGRNEAEDLKMFKVGQTDEEYDDLGNVYDLYQSLSEGETIVKTKEKQTVVIPMQTYTDQHTHKMDIRIGKEVNINPEFCDWDNHQACSSGLTCSPLN